MLLRWRVHISRYQNGYDERIDSDNSSHDHWYQALYVWTSAMVSLAFDMYFVHLHDQIWSERAHSCNPNA